MSTGAGGAFAYDANGSMTSRKTTSAAPVQTLTWSWENQLASVADTTGRVESYLYNENGERIRTVAAQDGITTTTYYLFPHYELEVTGSTGTIRRYYFFAGQRIAQTVNGGTVTYLHADHLGSTVLTTGVTGSAKYHAYGAQRAGFVNTKHQFTGHEADSGTGLIYMRARYYDPVIGQFISPDTVVPDPNNLYAYNRYMYAYGNPLRYTDPTGHYSNEEIMEHFDCHDWECVLQVFGSGGTLAGLGGWLNILELAQDGDSVAALNFQQMPGGGSMAASLMGVFMRQGGGRGSIQVQVTGFGSPDGATVAYSGGVMSSDAFAAFAGNSAIHGGYALAGQVGSASFSRGVYQQGVCDIWDCTEIGLTTASLGVSVAQTSAVACTVATLGACSPVLGSATTLDYTLMVASNAHSFAQYAQGKDSAFDLSLAIAQSALSVTPAVGVAADAVWLLYELADPILPTERWGAAKGAR